MEWVFDASVTLAWCFDDEKTPSTEVLFDRLAVTPDRGRGCGAVTLYA
jgi:hypothetical protein